MKIAMVNQPFGTINLPWTGEGGSRDIWIYEVAHRLARHCDIIVYTRKNRHQKKVEYDQKVQYRRISVTADEKFIRILSAVYRRLPKSCNFRYPLFASSLYYLFYALQVAKDLKSQKCDIAHIQNFSQFVPIIRAFNPKIKIILHMSCEWLTQLDKKMIESRLKKVDLIVGCSEYITKKIRHRFPQFAERCQTVLNGVDVRYFLSRKRQAAKAKNDVRRVLFVGRVSPEKGLHVLLNAFKKVVECYPQVHLKIVGSKFQLPSEWLINLSNDEKVYGLSSFYQGHSKATEERISYFTYLQRQLVSLKISDNVSFTGFVPYMHIVDHYLEADVLVNPSFSESFGRSLIEAMACQVPVVATRVGGMTEIVEDGKTGILVEPGDADALAEAILKLLSNENLRSSMGKTAQSRAVEFYSWEKVAENLWNHYKTLSNADVEKHQHSAV